MAETDCDVLISGGGPAGVMAGLLFARAGLRTVVLEKHSDFLRDFRGDTVHPSTLRLFAELGLLERFRARPHNSIPSIGAWIGDRHYDVADFSGFDRRWNDIVLMPQWHFLDFLADEARVFPGFSLRMASPALRPIEEDGRIAGLVTAADGRETMLRARLVIIAEGRNSRLRAQLELEPVEVAAPMDVFWFRSPKRRSPRNETTGIFQGGRIVILIDRGDYWQCAYVFAKGQSDAVRARGLESFRFDVAQAAPMLGEGIESLTSWDDVKLLTVCINRLERWSRPGLLVIGDAAHAMSPIGGVGINLAIQDAVAAANFLAGPLARGNAVDPLLDKVRARRMPAVRVVQTFQKLVQGRVIGPLLSREGKTVRAPLPIRLLDRYRWLRRLPAAFIGFGPRAEHVRSPEGLVPVKWARNLAPVRTSDAGWPTAPGPPG